MQGKRILLIVGGGIAAYKSLDLVRRLKERGVSLRAILTRAGAEFVTPLSLSVLTEEKAFTDLFDQSLTWNAIEWICEVAALPEPRCEGREEPSAEERQGEKEARAEQDGGGSG